MEKSTISNNLLYAQKHFDLLVNLNKLSFKNHNPLNVFLDTITESAVEGLNIDRASFWRIESDRLVCMNLFDKNKNAHIIQNDMSARDFPVYFKALSDGIAIVANDAKSNCYTKEFKDSYLVPNGITDMMDLPIRENGKVIGVLCCEHKDHLRTWSSSDLAFARSIANVLTLLIEQNKNSLIQEKLIESERKLSLITQNATDGFLVVEAQKVTYMSPSLFEMSGYDSSQISQLSVEDLFNNIHPDDKEHTVENIYANLDLKLTNFKYEFRLKLKNGLYSWREDNVSVIYDEDGNYSKYIAISRDINSIREDKAKIEKLYAIAKSQNEKLVNFTYIVSHNIRSNSCNISMLLDLLKAATNEIDKQNYLELLKTSHDKLSETLYFLNETINIQNNHNTLKTGVNIKIAIKKVINNLEILSFKNVKFSVIVPDDLMITTIPSYFESILYNLISNAVKYRSPAREAFVEINTEKISKATIITVKDNGIGINLEKNDDKLFGMYKTFHGNEDAVGLGLYMTKNQIEYLNGTIEVDSEINKGSTFKVIFYE